MSLGNWQKFSHHTATNCSVLGGCWE